MGQITTTQNFVAIKEVRQAGQWLGTSNDIYELPPKTSGIAWARPLMTTKMLKHRPQFELIRALQWRHNGCHGVSNHQPRDCLVNRLLKDQRKHQNPASLAFVRGIHRWPVNPPHKWPLTRQLFPFDDVIMDTTYFAFTGELLVPRCV